MRMSYRMNGNQIEEWIKDNSGCFYGSSSEGPYECVDVDDLREMLKIQAKMSYTPLELAVKFHETYENLAPKYGYETREETKKFDANSPNGKLMVAVCEILLSGDQEE